MTLRRTIDVDLMAQAGRGLVLLAGVCLAANITLLLGNDDLGVGALQSGISFIFAAGMGITVMMLTALAAKKPVSRALAIGVFALGYFGAISGAGGLIVGIDSLVHSVGQEYGRRTIRQLCIVNDCEIYDEYGLPKNIRDLTKSPAAEP